MILLTTFYTHYHCLNSGHHHCTSDLYKHLLFLTLVLTLSNLLSTPLPELSFWKVVLITSLPGSYTSTAPHYLKAESSRYTLNCLFVLSLDFFFFLHPCHELTEVPREWSVSDSQLCIPGSIIPCIVGTPILFELMSALRSSSWKIFNKFNNRTNCPRKVSDVAFPKVILKYTFFFSCQEQFKHRLTWRDGNRARKN